ncbi:MAG: xanthine dehydrogenase family protein subunit M [Dehalococcoidia bacterium]|nr:xanthine dehydrogenase family protein subunit M [Dehalococcoidia bacterium]
MNNDIKMGKYILAKSIEEALNALDKYGEKARVMAGSTDLLPLMRRTGRESEYLVDITAIGKLSYIKQDGEVIKIGALATHSDVNESPVVKKGAFVLAEACGMVGSPQIRNRGTLAGNIMNASPAADTAVALIALGAEAKITSKKGERIEKIESIFLGPGKTTLNSKELITELRFRALYPGEGSAFCKLAKRKGMAISIVNAAAFLSLDESRAVCRDARIAVGSVAPTPVRVKSAEDILTGQELGENMIEKASLAARDEVKPIDDIRGGAGYRREMTKVLISSAIRAATERAQRGNNHE